MRIICWAGALTVSYYLYKQQLGAIPFFLFSIYFFLLARKELRDRPNKELAAKKKLLKEKLQATKR
ncbi:hypothetical protein F4V44_00090 [Niallia endozanthoxylica]|uniref:Uncharacterized protein n=1 Tax=Niallia endozanthoxylica TaxID=2036016 RepID=A0A5J5I9F1_9BACI|nr:hypothetical protein F4V44_00090 [Niallia endozanthoxylica]